MLLEPSDHLNLNSITVANCLVDVPEDRATHMLLTNLSGFTQKLEENEWIGQATDVDLVEVEPEDSILPGEASAPDWKEVDALPDADTLVY